MMNVEFVDRDDGGVDVRIPGASFLLEGIFTDAITARAPRGAPEPGAPSTYWIDSARARALAAGQDASVNPIASGNITVVDVEGGQVVARFDFDPEDDPGSSLPLDEFIAVLDRWRELVVERCPSAVHNWPTPDRTRVAGPPPGKSQTSG